MILHYITETNYNFKQNTKMFSLIADDHEMQYMFLSNISLCNSKAELFMFLTMQCITIKKKVFLPEKTLDNYHFHP